MDERPLSGTGVNLSVIGVGTWAIGSGDWKYSWGPQNDKDSIEAIQFALDHGVNWIDTAAVYGLGHAEEVVQKAIKGRAQKPFIATKCGLLTDKKGEVYSDISKESIRREVEASLKRLRLEQIDLYQIHWPNPSKDIEEAFETLLKLKAEGKIRFAGVCNFSLEQLKRISKLGLPVSLQSPLSLVRPELTYEITPWCEDNKVSVLAYSPIQCGLLSGKADRAWVAGLKDWRRENKYFIEPKISEIFNSIERLERLMSGRELDNPVMSAALAWVISTPGVTSAIVGLRNREQAKGLFEALKFTPDKPLINEIAKCFFEP